MGALIHQVWLCKSRYLTWASDEALNVISTSNKTLTAHSTFEYELAEPIEVGSANVTWLSGGQAHTATDNSKGELRKGDDSLVGYIAYQNSNGVGEVRLLLNDDQPDSNSQVQVDYKKNTSEIQTVVLSGAESTINVTLNKTPAPGSINTQLSTYQYHDKASNTQILPRQSLTLSRDWSDNGDGTLSAGTLNGTIDYASKLLVINPLANYNSVHLSQEFHTLLWLKEAYLSQSLVASTEELAPQSLTIYYQEQGVTGVEKSETFPVGVMTVDFDTLQAQPIVPGSVRLRAGNTTIVDRNGVLVANLSSQTGAGTQVGTIDYDTHQAFFAQWISGDLTLEHMATSAALSATSSIVFSTANAPVARDGFIINAITMDGTRLVGSADADGNLTGDFAGSLNINTGLVTAYIPDPNNPSNTLTIVPQSLSYSCVVEQLVPLDKNVINIDPIRLPPDGRVPIYRAGDLLLIANTQHKAVGTPAANQVLESDRDYLAFADVIDSNGVSLKASERTIDLVGGKITLSGSFSLVDDSDQALTPPLSLVHRVEHMTPISEVQANGLIGLLTPNYHDFSAGDTVVCSCPIHGDKWAREYSFFTQKTWNSANPNWQDERDGSDTTAKFDTINYPVEMTNDGAVNERWALVFTSSTSFSVVGESLG
ncbi:hypothetical protein N9R79_12220, partial [Vibrio sp.]|nr:hypothetical protein [Vibrio sp.]